jgi:hypothetical protein
MWFLWLASLVVLKGRDVANIMRKKRYFLFYAFVVYYLFSSFLFSGLSSGFNSTIALMELTSPILMLDIYKDSSIRLKKFVAVFFLMIIALNTKDLISTINENPGMGIRSVVHIDADQYLKNAFNWVYTWVFITTSSVLFFKFFVKKGKNKKLLLLLAIFLLLGIYILFSSLFMTAIAMMLLGCVMALFYGRKRWLLKLIFAMSVGLVVFIMTFEVISNQLGMLAGGDFLTQRTGEIYHKIVGDGGDSHDMEARNDLTSMSFYTFLRNPLFGISHEISDFKQAQYSSVGYHSEWIDNLALYGLCYLLLFVFLIKSIQKGSIEAKPVYITYILTGFFNPIWYFPQNVVVFFFIPITMIFCGDDAFLRRKKTI